MSSINHDNTYDKPYKVNDSLLSAALAYARAGLPVFRLRAGTKEPFHGSRGFYDATTDETKIREWWTKTPTANIGIPTGRVSGFVALDVDRDEGGPKSLAELEAEHGKLPATWMVRTGRGGHHLWFRTPDRGIRNSAGDIGQGLDVRGDGGYVVAAPSIVSNKSYVTVHRSPVSEMPEWLLHELTRPRGGAGSLRSASQGTAEEDITVSIDTAGHEIPEGRRNDALTRIAGKLHDGTRSLGQLARDLQGINEARCSTPIPETEVRSIARSIHWRGECRQSNRAPEYVLEMLDIFEASAIWGGEWKGMAGNSDRSNTVALLRFARRYGRPYTAPGEDCPTGVEVSVDMKSLALEAATSERGAKRSVRRMREDPERQIFRRSTGGDGIAGSFVLDCRAKCHPSIHSGSPSEGSLEREPSGWGGDSSRAPFTAPRLRWTAPKFERGVRVGTIHRIGKGVEKVVDALEAAGGSLADQELAASMNLTRTRDLRRNDGPLDRAVTAGVVVDEGGHIWLSEDWLECLNHARDLAGEIEAYRLDQEKYEREKNARRTRHERPVDPAPTTEDMDEMRDSRADRRKEAIEVALVSLFEKKPEYRTRRTGQITAALMMFDLIPERFPRGVDPGGPPRDHEVAAILEENGVAA